MNPINHYWLIQNQYTVLKPHSHSIIVASQYYCINKKSSCPLRVEECICNTALVDQYTWIMHLRKIYFVLGVASYICNIYIAWKQSHHVHWELLSASCLLVNQYTQITSKCNNILSHMYLAIHVYKKYVLHILGCIEYGCKSHYWQLYQVLCMGWESVRSWYAFVLSCCT